MKPRCSWHSPACISRCSSRTLSHHCWGPWALCWWEGCWQRHTCRIYELLLSLRSGTTKRAGCLPAQPQDFSAACLNEMLKVTSNCLLCSCYIFQMLLVKVFPAALLLLLLLFFLRDGWAISFFEFNLKHRVMLFHSRLKENLLCAVFLFSKIIFFNRSTRLLPYQLHQLSMWWKTDLLLGICYALNLTACLLSAGRGWHALYI